MEAVKKSIPLRSMNIDRVYVCVCGWQMESNKCLFYILNAKNSLQVSDFTKKKPKKIPMLIIFSELVTDFGSLRRNHNLK